ncbi:hypothetical protein CHELA1G11_20703 [Hyphomicrobiales bacterium]|nr:hypothetical protein CHELA1G11_20703 [Hyphomicrobiales bacterium]CAH1691515.1 hypothetical protein CHELA1G2_21018 [Hyphomicrobiales bacterium]
MTETASQPIAADSSSPARVEIDPGHPDVARIVIDNPPVNAGSLAVRAGLLKAIEEVAASPAITAAVLIGAGTTFIAGSDIKEFGAPLADPQVPVVIAAIEACPKPIIAAIHGAALGGGYEIALGCDARVATVDAVVGLPEVTLGMIPGAGGTVRLPRLTDPARAIEIIVSGRRLKASEALDLGLIDAVAEGDLAVFAAAFARAHGKRRLGEAMPRPYDEAEFEAAAAAALREGGDRTAVREAVAAVRRALRSPFAEALRKERDVFQVLRVSDEAAALRDRFFAERRARREAAAAHAAEAPR